MAILGSFSEGFPVDFRSGGDTTKDAFGKHIQEIKKIYGILNSLDNGKVAADDVTTAIKNHINSDNPHPNWKPSLAFSDLTGDIDASKVVGTLTNANIGANKVLGLEDFINDVIPDYYGIIFYQNKPNGYAQFTNGLIVQWGYKEYTVTGDDSETKKWVSFPKNFPNTLFNVVLTLGQTKTDCNYRNNLFFQVIYDTFSTSGFYFYPQYADEVGNYQDPVRCYYIAIGY